MKKIISTLLLTAFIIPTFGMANFAEAENVSLKTDTTGTGIETPNVPPVIFLPPTWSLHLDSPNGGEIWDRNQVQTVKWILAAINPSVKEYKNYSCEEGKTCPIPQLPKELSIDLYRRVVYKGECLVREKDGKIKSEKCPTITERKIFVKHIAFANIGDNSYSWKIDNDIQNGNDYIIRISTEPYIYPTTASGTSVQEEPKGGPISILLPATIWDESDKTFTITGETPTPPPVPPVPPTPPTPDLKAIVEALQRIMIELTKVIALLNGMTINQ